MGSHSSPDCDEEGTVGSPSSIKANTTVRFTNDLPGGKPIVHVLNQSTEVVDRIYWAFTSATEKILVTKAIRKRQVIE